jgi:hypothetical protein
MKAVCSLFLSRDREEAVSQEYVERLVGWASARRSSS